jgi:hypothetical protein
MRARFAFLAPLLVLAPLVASDALAQATPNPIVFDTIDSYRMQYGGSGTISWAFVTGVQHGQSAASSLTLRFDATENGQACERAFIQMANRPGRFTVSVYLDGDSSATCAVAPKP